MSANGLRDLGSNPGRVIPKTIQMVLKILVADSKDKILELLCRFGEVLPVLCLIGIIECSPMVRETWVQSQVENKNQQKMVFDVSLLNTQQYKVRI